MAHESVVTYFANTDSRGKKARFGIKASDRTRHVYVIGKTGMGKSVLLENMAVQDIANGEGMAFVDPHGKTADLLLDYIPENRIKDVIYFAPFDTNNPIAFNIMEDVGYDKRHLVAAGLMSAFKKIWVDAWSARMEYILGNTIMALLEYPDATLLSVNRMLTDKDYRKAVIDNVQDPSIKSFWVGEFAKYTDKYTQEATPAIQNKIGQFTANPLIRNIVGQPKSSFDIRKLMDEKKILIINLSKGQIGEANANLLGSMLITKIYLAAMSRADVPETEMNRLPNFYLYVDEFQSFANESFADILSEARKYKLNLTIAHQYIEQMSEEVRNAVFGNVGTMIAFRVGAFDAEVLEKEFAPVFTAEDLVNLGFTQIYLKLMIDGIGSHPFSATTLPPIAPPEKLNRKEVIESSRASFAHPRAKVEEAIMEWYKPIEPARTRPKDGLSGPAAHAVKKDMPAHGSAGDGRRRSLPPRAFVRASVPLRAQRKEEGARGVASREATHRAVHSEAVSLDTLKRSVPARKSDALPPQGSGRGVVMPPRKDKGPTPENMKSLKEALEEAMKEKPPEAKAKETPKETPDTKGEGSAAPTAPREVPEDVLKKVLE